MGKTTRYYIPPREAGPREHLPVALIIDKSSSIERIREHLNRCVWQLVSNMKQDVVFRDSIELLVIHYSGGYHVAADFVPLAQITPQMLRIEKGDGHTATGEALLYALKRLDEKKQEWKRKAEKYYQPLCFLITDGYPYAGIHASAAYWKKTEDDYAAAARSIREREQNGKIVFMAAGIQQKDDRFRADIARLNELTNHPERVVAISEDLENINHFEDFFNLIEKATNAMFESTPIVDIVDDILGIGSSGETQQLW